MPVLTFALLIVGAGSFYAWRHYADGLAPTLLVLKSAIADLGVRESSPNSGPVVDEYLLAVGISPPANWCAAAVSAWIRKGYAARGKASPVRLSAQAKAFISEFERLKRWVPRAELRASIAASIPPGSVVIWSRGDPASWTGHIGIFERSNPDGSFGTIEGNSGPSGDRVARMIRRFDDPRLLGIGVLP